MKIKSRFVVSLVSLSLIVVVAVAASPQERTIAGTAKKTIPPGSESLYRSDEGRFRNFCHRGHYEKTGTRRRRQQQRKGRLRNYRHIGNRQGPDGQK